MLIGPVIFWPAESDCFFLDGRARIQTGNLSDLDALWHKTTVQQSYNNWKLAVEDWMSSSYFSLNMNKAHQRKTSQYVPLVVVLLCATWLLNIRCSILCVFVDGIIWVLCHEFQINHRYLIPSGLLQWLCNFVITYSDPSLKGIGTREQKKKKWTVAVKGARNVFMFHKDVWQQGSRRVPDGYCRVLWVISWEALWYEPRLIGPADKQERTDQECEAVTPSDCRQLRRLNDKLFPVLVSCWRCSAAGGWSGSTPRLCSPHPATMCWSISQSETINGGWESLKPYPVIISRLHTERCCIRAGMKVYQ